MNKLYFTMKNED